MACTETQIHAPLIFQQLHRQQSHKKSGAFGMSLPRTALEIFIQVLQAFLFQDGLQTLQLLIGLDFCFCVRLGSS